MRTHPVLSQLAGRGIRLGLEDTEAFLLHLGSPHLAAKVVHVAGTNGKGSTCTCVTRALVAAGHKVGTFTSPHLEHVNERLRIDGEPISDADLDAAITALDAERRAWATAQGMEEPPLTYFEFVTVLAFQVFAQQQVDVMVIEVGLGGRLDSTNVVQPLATAITSIGLDHVDKLGDNLRDIAFEKAGIFKPGASITVGPVDPDAAAVIGRRADEVGVAPWWVGSQVQIEAVEGGYIWRSPEGSVGPVRPAMAGRHQVENMAVVVGILHQCRRAGLSVSDEDIAEGISKGVLAGRAERLADDVWADGAHNDAGARALAGVLADLPREGHRILLFGAGGDRDPNVLMGPLVEHVDEVWLTRCAHPHALSPEELAERVDLPLPVQVAGDVEEALPRVRQAADQVIVAGSLYLVGAVRELLGVG